MKIRNKFARFAAALILSLTSLAILPVSKAFALAPYTCTWTGATNNNFNTAGNWTGCNSAAPQPSDNDNLIFDNTSLSISQTLTNDIVGLNVGTITFSGSTAHSYTLSGNAFNISGGITDTASTEPTINNNVALTANQTFTGFLNFGGNVDTGTFSLTEPTGNLSLATLSGSGTLIVNGNGTPSIYAASPDFSGTVQLNEGLLNLYNSGALGTATLTIASGASVTIDSTGNTATFPNNVTLAGTGSDAYGAIISCLSVSEACTSGNNTNLTLSGTITLTGNAEVANGAYYPAESIPPANTATLTFTGTINYNNFTLTAIPNSSTTVVLPALPAVVTAVSSTSKAAPKTPDTGFGLVAAHPEVTLALTGLCAAGIFVLSRHYRKVSSQR